jgi:hypothetical protein
MLSGVLRNRPCQFDLKGLLCVANEKDSDDERHARATVLP